jgi:hypothetical protein
MKADLYIFHSPDRNFAANSRVRQRLFSMYMIRNLFEIDLRAVKPEGTALLSKNHWTGNYPAKMVDGTLTKSKSQLLYSLTYDNHVTVSLPYLTSCDSFFAVISLYFCNLFSFSSSVSHDSSFVCVSRRSSSLPRPTSSRSLQLSTNLLVSF